MSLNKKGNLEMVLSGVMILAIAGFILVMGLVMMDDIYLSTSDTSITQLNETITGLDATGDYLTNSSLCGFNSMTITNMTLFNDSAALVPSTDYVSNSRTGFINISGAANASQIGANVNISVTFKYGNSSVCSAANATIDGQGSIADYFDLIALAIVIAVIISLIVIGFGRNKIVQ